MEMKRRVAEKIVPHDKVEAQVFMPASITEQMHLHGFYPTVHYAPMERYRDQLVAWLKELDVILKAPLKERYGLLFRRWELLRRRIADVPMVLQSEDVAVNVVMTVFANLTLDTMLAGSAFTTTGPYMFLIGAVSYVSTPVIADTMASHGTWTESGGTNAPVYTGNRPVPSFNSASARSKAASSAVSFTFTSAAVVKGAGLVSGSGAVATKDNTSGIITSGGLFTGGDKSPGIGDSLAVSYSMGA